MRRWWQRAMASLRPEADLAPLAPDGERRADRLAQMFGDAAPFGRLQRIYVTDTRPQPIPQQVYCEPCVDTPQGAVQSRHDGSFELFNSLVSPWHAWLDPTVYGRHVDTIEAISPTAIASAHGPVLRGTFIPGAFDRVRALAGQPITPPPGQETLDAIVETIPS